MRQPPVPRRLVAVIGGVLLGAAVAGAAVGFALRRPAAQLGQAVRGAGASQATPRLRATEREDGGVQPVEAAEKDAPKFPRCTLVVDPGHPSERNPGKTVQNGTTEVHIAWEVAVKLRDLLQARGARVVMTKS